MNHIQQQYHEIRLFFQKNIKRTFFVMMLIFSICLIAFSLALSVNPGLATRLLIKTNTIVDGTIQLSGILPMIFKNIFTGFYLIALGCIPFLFIPAWFVAVNGGMIGVLIGSTTISTITLGSIFASVVPHGIILIPAMLLASAYGIYLCRTMMARISHKTATPSYKQLFFELSRAYTFVIIPMMVIASLLQTLITPIIVSLL